MIKRIVTVILLLCQLGGLGFVRGYSAGTAPIAAAPLAEEGEAPVAGTTLRVTLPAGQQILSEILQEIAAAEGIALEIDVVTGEGGYVAQMLERYQETKPDIYWVHSEVDAQELFDNDIKPVNMRTNEAGLAIYTLARMTPAHTRVLDPRQVYGLPVGLVAEGTLVNIEQIASLLGSQDLAAVQRDLTFCSYEEWAVLCEGLASYFASPADTVVTLAGNKYTMPRYRPENARLQRGLYAMATGQPGAFLQNTLTAAFATAYEDPTALFSSSPEEMAAIMAQPLEAVFGRLELDTRYMTDSNSTLSRGEGYSGEAKISAAEAEKLFAADTALFIKGDTQTGLRLETEYPRLEGKLTMIPNKLPRENENVAVINEMFGLSAAGTLCVGETSPNQEAAFRLLAALFTTDAGRNAIEQRLHLACFSDPFPRGGLQSQLMEALSFGNVYAQPATQESLSAMETVMGQWADSELMSLEEWGEDQLGSFTTMAQGTITVLGLSRA